MKRCCRIAGRSFFMVDGSIRPFSGSGRRTAECPRCHFGRETWLSELAIAPLSADWSIFQEWECPFGRATLLYDFSTWQEL